MKEESKGLTIKDVPLGLLAAMRKRADEEGRSVQEMLRRHLLQEYGDTPKPAIMRWIDIDALPGRTGEIDWSEVDCSDCGDVINRPFKALFADGSWSATVCSRCATSE